VLLPKLPGSELLPGDIVLAVYLTEDLIVDCEMLVLGITSEDSSTCLTYIMLESGLIDKMGYDFVHFPSLSFDVEREDF
jgi:hypothetical protein